MVDETAGEAERRYAASLVAVLRGEGPWTLTVPMQVRGTPYLHVIRWDLIGTAPDTELRVVFRVLDRPCTFGIIERIWEERELDFTDARLQGMVSNSLLRWEEGVATGELPHRCSPDAEGITWMELWLDW